MFPQFFNPHLSRDSVQIVPRATLDDLHDSNRAEGTQDRSQMLAELEETLKRSFGDIYESDVKVPAEDPARKRRRLEHKLGASNSSFPPESLPFRLLSHSLPPKPLLLQPEPTLVVIVKEPPCEDTASEAKLRAAQAQAAAVDITWLLAESRKSYPTIKRNILHVNQQSLTSDPPAMMIAKRAKQPSRTPKISHSIPPSEVLPSPHSLPKDVCCPQVDIEVPPSQSVPANARKRRRNPHAPSRPRPPAMFWRPTFEMGKKSFGYAIGYESSWPIAANDPQRYSYQRDTMRKGFMRQ